MPKYYEVSADKFELAPKKLTGEDYLNMWKGAGGHDFVEPEEPSK